MLHAVVNNLAIPAMVPEINQMWPLLVRKEGSGDYLPKKSELSIPERRLHPYTTLYKTAGYGDCESWEKGMLIDTYI